MHYLVLSGTEESENEWQSLELSNLLSFSSAVMSVFAISSSDMLAEEMLME